MFVIEESESPAAICLKRNICTAPKTPAYCAQQKGMRKISITPPNLNIQAFICG
jgi:hypothetical protein